MVSTDITKITDSITLDQEPKTISGVFEGVLEGVLAGFQEFSIKTRKGHIVAGYIPEDMDIDKLQDMCGHQGVFHVLEGVMCGSRITVLVRAQWQH